MPVTAYVLLCRETDRGRVRRALARLGSVEVGAAHARGLAVVAVTPDEAAAEAMRRRLAALPGVREAIPVGHYFEDTIERAMQEGTR
jgi:nitrate reductase NapAB chaperone NapD